MPKTPATLQTQLGETAVEIRRSSRRTRTVSAYRDPDDATRVVVLVPARLTAAQERTWVEKMVAKVGRDAAAPRRPPSDTELSRRAGELSTRYLGGRARPASVRWVPPMRTRWASCSPADATIRMSRRLRELPQWVQDYVLVHELAHLLEPGHDARFWSLVANYPRTERARGYLDGVSAAAGLQIADDMSDDLFADPTSD